MTSSRTEVAVQGMDCAECTRHVQQAIAGLPGVEQVEVFLAGEKAVVAFDPTRVDLSKIRAAVVSAGYQAPVDDAPDASPGQVATDMARQATRVLGLVVGAVLVLVVVGEWLGLLDAVTEFVPWPVGWLLVLVAWWPVLMNVLRAAWRRQVLAHTLMSLGVIAALAVGEWTTAGVVVFFMRIGDFVEHFTAERARDAVRNLAALAPTTARVLRNGQEVETPVGKIAVGEVVVVRPGESIPVDGTVVDGDVAGGVHHGGADHPLPGG